MQSENHPLFCDERKEKLPIDATLPPQTNARLTSVPRNGSIDSLKKKEEEEEKKNKQWTPCIHRRLLPFALKIHLLEQFIIKGHHHIYYGRGRARDDDNRVRPFA